MSAGGRGRMRAQAGREGIEVDPVDILETLEAALALNINDERRNHLLRVFEQAGAAWVRHLEVDVPLHKCTFFNELFLALGPGPRRVCKPVP